MNLRILNSMKCWHCCWNCSFCFIECTGHCKAATTHTNTLQLLCLCACWLQVIVVSSGHVLKTQSTLNSCSVPSGLWTGAQTDSRAAVCSSLPAVTSVQAFITSASSQLLSCDGRIFITGHPILTTWAEHGESNLDWNLTFCLPVVYSTTLSVSQTA